ncbi:MAG: hypothetical protein AMJ46_12115 [Latescibacteria bacterium DG_63]|nr:MAG: hypothetical protein AMJ46_12115 [Latescibacteria bacterium DG_63]
MVLRKVVKRVGVVSCGKILGAIYAAFGLLAGALFSIFSIFGAVLGAGGNDFPGPLIGLFFGIGAIFILPIMYGIMGFVGGAITAIVYNAVAGFAGGLELDLE